MSQEAGRKMWGRRRKLAETELKSPAKSKDNKRSRVEVFFLIFLFKFLLNLLQGHFYFMWGFFVCLFVCFWLVGLFWLQSMWHLSSLTRD